MSHLKEIEAKILFVLYENREGLGYNELKHKIPEKSLRKYLPNHIKQGYVRIEERKVRGGIQHMHILTQEGRDYVKFSSEIEKIENEFREKFGLAYSDIDKMAFKKKLELYEKIFVSLFEDCLKADPKFAIRLVNTTVFAIRKVAELKMQKEKVMNTIRKALLEKLTSG